jgi:hypothetical protein
VKFAFVCQSAAFLGQQSRGEGFATLSGVTLMRACTRSPRGSQRASHGSPRGSAEQRQALMLAVEPLLIALIAL